VDSTENTTSSSSFTAACCQGDMFSHPLPHNSSLFWFHYFGLFNCYVTICFVLSFIIPNIQLNSGFFCMILMWKINHVKEGFATSNQIFELPFHDFGSSEEGVFSWVFLGLKIC
jgi:hypothetical protein